MVNIDDVWITVSPADLSKPMPKPDYEGEFVRAIRTNLTKVIDQLDIGDTGLSKKIGTFASRFAFAVDTVEKKIRDDEMFRAFFAKDPGKQKIHENIAAAFIECMPGVSNFKQLAHDSLVVIQGAVRSRKDVRAEGATARAKTIDFSWSFCSKDVYASHKYTKQGGGAQDNQYRDLQEFIREANESNLKNTYFLAIADGEYYGTADMNSQTTKLQHLKDISNRRNVLALSIDELEEWMKEACAQAS